MSDSAHPSPGSTTAARWAATLRGFVDRFVVRVVLSVAIIVSLLPMPWVSRLDAVFLAMFGAEFVLRLLVLVLSPPPEPPADGLGMHRDPHRGSPPAPARSRSAGFVLMVFDLVALLSFLPLSGTGARWLRIFRLTRMVLLVGYWAPLIRDVWGILARRERARQLLLMGFVVGVLSFAGAVVVFHMGEQRADVTGDEVVDAADAEFGNLLWWSFRQVQDPGNMLEAPFALPAVIISLALTVAGLFLVSFLIGMGTDVVQELLELSRIRAPGLHDHNVIVNITPSTQRVLHELMRYYRKLLPTDARPLTPAWFSDLRRRGVTAPRYVVVGNSVEPPEFLRQPELTKITYRQRPDDEEDLIRRTDLLLAKRVVLIADATDPAPDAETIRSLLTLVERLRARERSPDFRRPRRHKVVIAEILDESNVSAAQAALANATASFRGFIIPTEKLLALFFASVVRRPGLGYLLEELLTSRGHEIYTCFFQSHGLGFSMDRPPRLDLPLEAALDRLLQVGLHRGGGSGGRVIPIGLLVHREGLPGEPDFEVRINPEDDLPGVTEQTEAIGFVAVADNFRSIREFAEALPQRLSTLDPKPDDPPEEVALPRLDRTHRTKTTKVLVCGFRPGSVYMLEELFRSDPGGEVLVLVEDRAARRRALDALQAHSELVERGLMHGRHGVFRIDRQSGRILFRPYDRPSEADSVMYLEVADWMASRFLVNLPLDTEQVPGFADISKLDAIVFVASDRVDADKRITTALLKLERLFGQRLAPGVTPPRVVAEVMDGKLATRLEQRCIEMGIDNVRVFSIQELRAYFLFQSVVVPGFDSMYGELLGSWGESLVHKHVVEPRSGSCTFEALARHLRLTGEILVAVELRGSERPIELCVAPSGSDLGTRFDLCDLIGVWVVAPDSGEVAAAREARSCMRANLRHRTE